MGYSSFQIGCVFVEYGLFNTTNLLLNLIFIRFGIILTQFYLNFARQDRSLIYIVQFLRFSGFSLYPLNFSFTVPLNVLGWEVVPLNVLGWEVVETGYSRLGSSLNSILYFGKLFELNILGRKAV